LPSQSVGRKVLSDGTEQDTDDNSADFEIDTPTPKAQNITYVEPPVVPSPPPEETDTTPPTITVYTLQVSGETATSENNVFINSNTGAKIQINVDELSTFKIWINEKEYWYTTTLATSITRPSNCSPNFWKGTKNSCSGDILPDGVYIIKVEITDEAGNVTTDTSKTITIDNTAPVIALNGDAAINLAVGGSYQELGAAAADNIDGSDEVTIGGDTVDTLTPATFRVP
jgi:hypothetical protein